MEVVSHQDDGGGSKAVLVGKPMQLKATDVASLDEGILASTSLMSRKGGRELKIPRTKEQRSLSLWP